MSTSRMQAASKFRVFAEQLRLRTNDALTAYQQAKQRAKEVGKSATVMLTAEEATRLARLVEDAADVLEYSSPRLEFDEYSVGFQEGVLYSASILNGEKRMRKQREESDNAALEA